jgi:hypothetical protein
MAQCAGFQSQFSGLAELRRQKSEPNSPEEVGICTTKALKKRELFKARSSQVHLKIFQESLAEDWATYSFTGQDYLRLTGEYLLQG